MTAEVLLSRLEKVRRTGDGRWIARCPAHDSRSGASLAIRELPDGRVLLHDFGGCGVEDVLGAAGLTFDALFPERRARGTSESAGEVVADVAFVAADVLCAVAADTLHAAVLTSDVAAGRGDAEAARGALWLIAQRLAAAAALTNPPRRDAHGRRR